MNNGKLIIEKNDEEMVCHIDGPTEKAAIVIDAMPTQWLKDKLNMTFNL